MIKIFRNFRQNMLKENRTSKPYSPAGKYLLYAIGEIILVVIGILIALQINNWNQNTQDRRHEAEILNQLHNEFASNLQQLSSKIAIRKTTLNSCFKLLEYRKLEGQEVVADSFNLHLSRAIIRPTYDPELGVTEELTNSGKLYLIRNSELRHKITSFKSSLGDLREEEMVIFNNTENIVIPFIIEHYQLGRMVSEFLDDTNVISQISLSKNQNYTSVKELFEKADFDEILYHPDFEDHLANIVANTIYTNQQSEGVKERIEIILQLVNSEIQRRE